MRRTFGHAVWTGLENLGHAGLAKVFLAASDHGAHAVARKPAASEHNEAVGAAHASAAVGQRLDRQLNDLAFLQPTRP